VFERNVVIMKSAMIYHSEDIQSYSLKRPQGALIECTMIHPERLNIALEENPGPNGISHYGQPSDSDRKGSSVREVYDEPLASDRVYNRPWQKLQGNGLFPVYRRGIVGDACGENKNVAVIS